MFDGVFGDEMPFVVTFFFVAFVVFVPLFAVPLSLYLRTFPKSPAVPRSYDVFIGIVVITTFIIAAVLCKELLQGVIPINSDYGLLVILLFVLSFSIFATQLYLLLNVRAFRKVATSIPFGQCSSCHYNLSSDARFCPRCGTAGDAPRNVVRAAGTWASSDERERPVEDAIAHLVHKAYDHRNSDDGTESKTRNEQLTKLAKLRADRALTDREYESLIAKMGHQMKTNQNEATDHRDVGDEATNELTDQLQKLVKIHDNKSQ